MGKGIPQKVSFHHLFTANVYDGGCKRLRWQLQTFAGKVANVCGEKRQCTAGTVAVHCGSGCSALRLRRVKLTPKSPVLFRIREKGGETHHSVCCSSPWNFCLTNIESDVKDCCFWFCKVSKWKQNTCNRLHNVTKRTISVTYLLESIISVNKKYGIASSDISKRNTFAVKTLQNESKSTKTLSKCIHK